MYISLLVNNSPANVVNKNVTIKKTVQGNLREGSSVVDPVILFELDENPTLYNYAIITEFNRSYFITDWVCERTGLWRATMHCDVLSSFWNRGISSSMCVVGRNEYQRQDDLIDDQMYFTADSLYGVYAFPNTPFNGAGYSMIVAGAGSSEESLEVSE